MTDQLSTHTEHARSDAKRTMWRVVVLCPAVVFAGYLLAVGGEFVPAPWGTWYSDEEAERAVDVLHAVKAGYDNPSDCAQEIRWSVRRFNDIVVSLDSGSLEFKSLVLAKLERQGIPAEIISKWHAPYADICSNTIY